MSKVLVINRGYHDYSDAQRFGKLTFMSEGRLDKYCVGKILRDFEPFIKDSEKDDHILVSSMTVANILAGCLFVLKHKALNLLIYNEQERKYISRRIMLDNLLYNMAD